MDSKSLYNLVNIENMLKKYNYKIMNSENI